MPPTLVRYDIRKEENGWTVYDVFTGQAVVIDGAVQAGLDIQDADDLADRLTVAADDGLRDVLQ